MNDSIDFLADASRELVTLGVGFTRHIHDRTIANPDTNLAKAATAFENVSRGTRKAILLAQRLDQPPRRIAARKQIIRAVEDNIQRHAAEDDDEADTLQAELLDRLDTLDLEDEIDSRPVETIITRYPARFRPRPYPRRQPPVEAPHPGGCRRTERTRRRTPPPSPPVAPPPARPIIGRITVISVAALTRHPSRRPGYPNLQPRQTNGFRQDQASCKSRAQITRFAKDDRPLHGVQGQRP